MVNHVTYWEVSDNFSEDGRDPHGHKVIGCFSKQEVANQYAEGNGNYGHDARVQRKDLVIVDSIEELEKATKIAKIQAALSKLTEEEKELLGIHKARIKYG